jgi:hypothetical protein
VRRHFRIAAWVAGLGLIVGGASTASAQNAMNAFGGFQPAQPSVAQPPAQPSVAQELMQPSAAQPSTQPSAAQPSVAQPSMQPSVAQPPGSYMVAPALPGAGGTYGYVQQNVGGAMGMSPNAYYSRNYFTQTPMRNTYYGAGYQGFTYTTPMNAPGYTYGAPGYTSTTPTYAYGTTTYPYATRTRRVGPLRRLFGGWR